MLANIDRFWTKVNKTDSCWNWTAGKSDRGYGKFSLNYKHKYAHRVSYELLKGLIPKGLELDHLCRNTSCVNPSHLEAVSHAENMKRGLTGKINNYNKRKTHCPQGHEFNKNNTYYRKTGWRDCRMCNKFRNRKEIEIPRDTKANEAFEKFMDDWRKSR